MGEIIPQQKSIAQVEEYARKHDEHRHLFSTGMQAKREDKGSVKIMQAKQANHYFDGCFIIRKILCKEEDHDGKSW